MIKVIKSLGIWLTKHHCFSLSLLSKKQNVIGNEQNLCVWVIKPKEIKHWSHGGLFYNCFYLLIYFKTRIFFTHIILFKILFFCNSYYSDFFSISKVSTGVKLKVLHRLSGFCSGRREKRLSELTPRAASSPLGLFFQTVFLLCEMWDGGVVRQRQWWWWIVEGWGCVCVLKCECCCPIVRFSFSARGGRSTRPVLQS